MAVKKISLLLALCAFAFSSWAQSTGLSYKLYGFVENQFIFDSRKNYEGAGGLLHFQPMPERLDENGKDLNATSSAELVGINARVGLDVGGLTLRSAKLSAKIEADFAGVGSGYFGLRLRRAYVNANWGKTTLTLGQDWHPLSISVMPSTYGLNGGAPFNPFNRSPQLNFKYKPGKWQFTAAAIYQMQYNSDGPSGRNAIYMRQGILPNIFVGIENKVGSFRYGIGGDMKMISPRTESSVVDNNVTKYYKVDEKITSFSGMIYGEYAQNKLTVKGKAIYGQNLTDMLMVGGYAVKNIDAVTGRQEYESFNSVSAWLNVVYGNKFRVGLFGGYLQNLGVSSALALNGDNTPILYTGGFGYQEGQMIDCMYRIVPQISYNLPNWRMGIEYDITGAMYGNLDLTNGKATDTHHVLNHRILCMVSYIF